MENITQIALNHVATIGDRNPKLGNNDPTEYVEKVIHKIMDILPYGKAYDLLTSVEFRYSFLTLDASKYPIEVVDEL